MVDVRLRRDSRNRLSSFFAEGHAGWADAGEDVVCAAVSTLLQAAWLGLSEVCGLTVEGSKCDGRLELRWPATARDDAGTTAIVETVARSIERLAQQFPGHVRAHAERENESES